MKAEDKEVLQQVLDNLSYTKGYKEQLIEFNKGFNPHNGAKFTNEVKEFKFLFPLDKAI